MEAWMNRAAQLAYQLLAGDAPARLPVNVTALIRRQNHVELLTYAQAALLLNLSPDAWRWEVPSPDAFTLIEQASTPVRYKIFYDETKPLTRQRFTLAHELGHLLFHRAGYDQASAEAAMDCFARHLLCPPVLMSFAGSDNPPEDWLCRTFGLSPAAVSRLKQSPCGQVDAVLAQRVRDKFASLLKQP